MTKTTEVPFSDLTRTYSTLISTPMQWVDAIIIALYSNLHLYVKTNFKIEIQGTCLRSINKGINVLFDNELNGKARFFHCGCAGPNIICL